MISRFISIISCVVSFYLVYKYRYRILNVFLRKSWLRKIAVSMAMQIPFIRDKVLGSVMPFQQRENW